MCCSGLKASFQSSPAATSIHPSDSISQSHQSGSHVSGSHVSILPASQVQPAIRPSEYPFEVLWHLEDCRQDVDVDVRESNKSRPSMDRAIRHPDGTMINDSEWSAIKSSARRIANELLALPDCGSVRQAKMQKTKTYYQTNHAKDWTRSITRLETEQPLLKLCASNWKADHVLGNSIQAIVSRDATSQRARKKQEKEKEKDKGMGTGKVKERERRKVKLKGGDDGDDDDSDEDEGDMASSNKSASEYSLYYTPL